MKQEPLDFEQLPPLPECNCEYCAPTGKSSYSGGYCHVVADMDRHWGYPDTPWRSTPLREWLSKHFLQGVECGRVLQRHDDKEKLQAALDNL